jgi:hypothetical protein
MIAAAPIVTPISAAIWGSSESVTRTIAWLEKPASASSAMARVGVARPEPVTGIAPVWRCARRHARKRVVC